MLLYSSRQLQENSCKVKSINRSRNHHPFQFKVTKIIRFSLKSQDLAIAAFRKATPNAGCIQAGPVQAYHSAMPWQTASKQVTIKAGHTQGRRHRGSLNVPRRHNLCQAKPMKARDSHGITELVKPSAGWY